MKLSAFLLGILSAISLFCASDARAAAPPAPEFVKVAWLRYADEYLVRWHAVPDATGYNVYRYDTNSATWVQVVTNYFTPPWNVLSFREPSGADPGPATYGVSALNVDGEGPITSASVVPGPGLDGTFYVGWDWWAKGYTFIDPGFQYDRIDEGTDGMVEFGPDATNFTHAAWNTNFSSGQRLHITNMPPGTIWVTRMTMVNSNGIGISLLYPSFGVYTLPLLPIDVWEDTENSIFVGDYSWAAPAEVFGQAQHGTVVPGSYAWDWKYIPETNFAGIDTFQILDNPDGPPVTLTLNVQNVNDLPVASSFNITIAEDTPILIGPTVCDLENDPYTLVFAYGLYEGGGNVLTQGTNLLWIPWTNWVGTAEFYFVAWDADAGPLAHGTITVTNINDAPYAEPMVWWTPEDVAVDITLVATDADGDPVTYELVDLPLHGTLSGTAPNLTYTPNPNFNGTDMFTYRAHDPLTNSEIALFQLTIAAVNDPPIALGQSITTAEDTPVVIALSGSDVDGDALTFDLASPPQYGTFINGTYTPFPNYHGTDSFTYKANDGQLDSAPATVNVTITPVNDAPAADNKSVTTTEDQSLVIPLTGSDLEGSSLTFSTVNPPAHGTFANGIYTPASNYNGPDSFTYKANDGQLDSPVATVNITITPVNDAPVAHNKSVGTAEDQSVAIALTGSDVEGSTLTFAIVTPPTQGTFANGVYTPAANYNGTDTFTYKANDGQLDSALATVSITITAVNDAPLANAQSVSTPYNTTANITLTGSDVEGSALIFTVVTTPANGTLTGAGANRTFTPNIGWSGTTTFTFKVNDGAQDSATATVTITVAAPTSIPTAPSALTATVISQTQINLGWNDNSSNEDGFKIERSPNGTSSWVQIATVGVNIHNYNNTGLTKNTRYYYRVRSYNSLGNSAYSNTVNARTLN